MSGWMRKWSSILAVKGLTPSCSATMATIAAPNSLLSCYYKARLNNTPSMTWFSLLGHKTPMVTQETGRLGL